MKERILAAYQKANEICLAEVGGIVNVPKEDQKILNKYLDLGYITLKKKKVSLGKGIYYPSLQADEFEELSGTIWLRIIRYCMERNGISSGIGPNSVKEYVLKPWEYGIDDLKVIRDGDCSKKHLEAEAEAWNIVMKEVEDETAA